MGPQEPPTFEEILEAVERFVFDGGQIKIEIEEDWSTEVHFKDAKGKAPGWVAKTHWRLPLCRTKDDVFDLINELPYNRPDWHLILEDAINSGNTLEYLRRLKKLESFE